MSEEMQVPSLWSPYGQSSPNPDLVRKQLNGDGAKDQHDDAYVSMKHPANKLLFDTDATIE